MSRKDRTSDRRGFFRLGLESLRESVVQAAQALGDAAEAAVEDDEQAAARGQAGPEQRGDKVFHRARVRSGEGGARRLVRPPGAVDEKRFLNLCTRCGDCGSACPEGAIFRAGPQHGPTLELTPYLVVSEVACFLCDGVPCAAACPTGALEPIEAEAIRLGTAVVTRDLCVNTRGDGCSLCEDVCPRPGAIQLGADSIPRVDPSVCVGCGLCAMYCKAYPKALHCDPNG